VSQAASASSIRYSTCGVVDVQLLERCGHGIDHLVESSDRLAGVGLLAPLAVPAGVLGGGEGGQLTEPHLRPRTAVPDAADDRDPGDAGQGAEVGRVRVRAVVVAVGHQDDLDRIDHLTVSVGIGAGDPGTIGEDQRANLVLAGHRITARADSQRCAGGRSAVPVPPTVDTVRASCRKLMLVVRPSR
jgi:hypothetical protein